jgi:hypothetical protein
MFNVAIDSKLRGCDVVTLKVEDIAPNGYAIDRGCGLGSQRVWRFQRRAHMEHYRTLALACPV